jgi:tetratricopeptide (TPR) repeat protein
MDATIEIIRGELERLFTLDELTRLSTQLLGLDPEDVGGVGAKASFARALAERCHDDDRVEALVDVILVSRREVDPRVRDFAALFRGEEIAPGETVGPFEVERKIGEGEVATVYLAKRSDTAYVVKVLRRDASRDRRAVARFLTANRLVAAVAHEGLPWGIEARELPDGTDYVAYEYIPAQTLAQRFARTGPSHISDLKPILVGILEPLSALHRENLVHGDLKLENVLVSRVTAEGGEDALKVTLVDFGTDRLRPRSATANGHSGLLAVFGSKKTIAPEQVRGKPADSRSDVYAFGAMLYELLTGKAVFATENATEAAFAHLREEPEPPSAKAPRAWVTRELDRFVLSLLQKDPAQRPRDAQAVLEALGELDRASEAAARSPSIAPPIEGLVESLLAAPHDAETALALDLAVDEGADPDRVAEAFVGAASAIFGDLGDANETKKGLLYRAARLYEKSLKDREKADAVYTSLIELDPADEVARAALLGLKKHLGKYEDVIEILLARSQETPSDQERAGAMAEIGHIYSHELDDVEQALVAYGQAVCYAPKNDSYAAELEKLAGDRVERWTEVLASLTEHVRGEDIAPSDRSALLLRTGGWYVGKTPHYDLALLALQEVLKTDPANEKANEGLTAIYKKAQEWPLYAAILLQRADAAGATPRGRDLRVEAAHTFEAQLGDERRAKDYYAAVLAEDPSHDAASDGLARLAEKTGDFRTLVGLLERRANALRGGEKAETLIKAAEIYEDHLNDLAEATRRYESVLGIDADNLAALKGLDRIYNRLGRYPELLANLEHQIEVSITPRQKINLLERVAALHEEEFFDHAKAATALEAILAIDGSNEAALMALARHYKPLSRWEDLVELYERHTSLSSDPARIFDLHVQRARVLADQIGSPEQAIRAYEKALELEPGDAGALEAVAHLRELTGDANAALTAIEGLASQAKTPEAQAEQWMRAGRLLEGCGDLDGAIERYKAAIEANPKDASASAALRKAYAHRGDAASVVALIDRELEHADGKLAKARLYAEAARVYHEGLHERDKASVAAEKAAELDPTNAEAFIVRGDLAFEADRYVEASRLYESVVGRTQILSKEEAVRVLTRYVEALGKTVGSIAPPPPSSGEAAAAGPSSASHPRVAAAVEALYKLAPDDVTVLGDIARVLFEFGDPKTAREAYYKYLAKAESELSQKERARALYGLGESERRAGFLDSAVEPLVEAAELDPDSHLPLQALSKIYEAQGKWEEAVRAKNQRLELATGAERFDLLLEIGDLELHKIGDRQGAERSFALALDERPNDRKILTRLMQLYSEDKDWAKLVETVLRLAEFVPDEKQRAKYLHTAAMVSARELGEVDEALEYYELAIELDPLLDKAIDEAIELKRTRGDHAGVEKLLNQQIERAKEHNDRDKLIRVLDQLGELYAKFLNEPSLAVDAYEAAQAFDPDDEGRAEILAELYASNVAEYLDKAVHAQAQLLRQNPYRVDSYKLLRRLYTEAKRGDAAWCLCQALTVLKLAGPDEERFYRRHRADNAAPAQAALDENDWTNLAHQDLDPLVTRIFALIQPTIIRTRTQSLETMGYDPAFSVDLGAHPYPVSQTLYYAHGVLGMRPPLVFTNPNDPGGLGFLHAQTPGIVLGRAAFESQVSTQALAFLAGRHLTYFRPGYYVRHLVPTGTGLKAWLFAAIKLSAPQFPVAADLEGQVAEAMTAMGSDFQGVQKELLASQVSKVLQSGTTLDLKKWVASIDHTADRAGLILCHDLGVATEVLNATDDASGVPSKERIKEIVLFGVSESYMAVRRKLGIAIDS